MARSIDRTTITERLNTLGPWGLALLRITVGVVFIAHGWTKVTVLGLDGFSAFLAQHGIPFPQFNAVLATATELLGGLALVAGLGTRLVSVPLAITMVVAILSVHNSAFFLPTGSEYALTLLAATIAFTLNGGGALALDNRLFGASTVTPTPALARTPEPAPAAATRHAA